MGRKNQRRGKQQEYRLKEALEKMDDVEIVKYYGQREGNAGDFLVKVGRHQVRFDHKSTSDDVVIRLEKDWMVKLTGINMRRMDEEGASVPCISFTIGGKRGIYVMCTRPYYVGGDDYFTVNTKFKTNERFRTVCPITSGMLNDHPLIHIVFDSYEMYVYKLTDFIERVKKHG